jgi:hypothetical protein
VKAFKGFLIYTLVVFLTFLAFMAYSSVSLAALTGGLGALVLSRKTSSFQFHMSQVAYAYIPIALLVAAYGGKLPLPYIFDLFHDNVFRSFKTIHP